MKRAVAHPSYRPIMYGECGPRNRVSMIIFFRVTIKEIVAQRVPPFLCVWVGNSELDGWGAREENAYI
jgi:hypothetical protein